MSPSLRKTLKIAFGATLLALSVTSSVKALPTHPGGYIKQTELDLIRHNVAAKVEPWATAWTSLQKTSPDAHWIAGIGTGALTDSYAIQNQGHAIWVLTAKWVASGDVSYALAAQHAIDKWVNNVTDMTACTTLRTGIGGCQMANAAEILAHGFGGSAGWPAANVAKAQAWFKAVPYKAISGGVRSRTGNWGTSAMTGCMAMAIFCDDQTMFDYAVDAYKFGFQDTQDGCCGVTEYIDATGEAMESGRDMGHVQGGIAHLVEVALMAWNQNVNLVPYTNTHGTVGANGVSYGVTGANRLFLGMEYEAKYNLGNDVPYHPYPICSGQIYYPNGIAPRAGWSPIWEMANQLFKAAGLNPTYTKQVIALPTYEPEYTNGDHVGLGTLLFHSDLSAIPGPKPPGPGGRLDRTGWTIKSFDSQETTKENGSAANVLDGKTNTYWHTAWSGTSNPGYPHEIQIDMKSPHIVTGLAYLPRQDGNQNGWIAGYQIYLSTDGTNWGSPASTGVWAKNGTEKLVNFAARTCRYVRLVATSEVNGQIWASAAEINIISSTKSSPSSNSSSSSSSSSPSLLE